MQPAQPDSQKDHRKYPGVFYVGSLTHLPDVCVSTLRADGKVTSLRPEGSTWGSLRPPSSHSCEASSKLTLI